MTGRRRPADSVACRTPLALTPRMTSSIWSATAFANGEQYRRS